MTEIEKQYASYSNGCECIWGALSLNDPIAAAHGGQWTMNDLSVLHHLDSDEYSLELNTAINFLYPKKYGARQYIGNLLDRFTNWMRQCGYNTEYPITLFEVFAAGINIHTKHKSIEKLYRCFQLLALSFIDSNFSEELCAK